MIEQDTHTTRLKLGEENAPSFSESELAAIAKRILWKHEDKFFGQNGQEDWKGGIGRQFTLDDVVSVLSGIEDKEVSAQKLTPNTNLAITQALRHAEVEGISNSQIAELRNEARRETRKMYRVQKGLPQEPQAEKLELKKSKRKWGWRTVAAPIIPVLALTAYAGSELINSGSDDIDINSSQPRTLQVFEGLSQEQEEPRTTIRLPSFINDIGKSVGEVVKPIPKVEELSSKINTPFNIWGFNLADKEAGITFEWNSSGVVDVHDGNLLSINFHPQSYSGRKTQPDQCLNDVEQDCVFNVDGANVLTVHTNWVTEKNGNSQDWGYFVEGGSKENPTSHFSKDVIGERIALLEQDGVTLIQEDHKAQAAVAIVRVEQRDKHLIYDDLSQALSVAMSYDPNIGTRVNLNKDVLIAITCGRLLPEDKQSGHNENFSTSSVYVIIIGEAPVS